ncbi:MAG: hypothetical protein U0804_02660 [Gemmataceae bacterium]
MKRGVGSSRWASLHPIHVEYTYESSKGNNCCGEGEGVKVALHEAVTRNHRCRTMDELLDLTFDWFATSTHFQAATGLGGESP